ncbi:minor capsid protein [Capybara microvirus Cap1_SP_164]|nr:minor capsid protein [Capybara microvirus Cap1_SP_164]
MIFKTQFSPHRRYFCNSGMPDANVYSYVIDPETGVKDLQITGVRDLQELIQANYLSGNVALAMQLANNGDDSYLNLVKGFYADVTDMPSTYAEAVSRVNEAHKIFSQFPPEFKELFNNSPDEFWSQVGSDEFKAKLFDYDSSDEDLLVAEDPNEEVVDHE